MPYVQPNVALGHLRLTIYARMRHTRFKYAGFNRLAVVLVELYDNTHPRAVTCRHPHVHVVQLHGRQHRPQRRDDLHDVCILFAHCNAIAHAAGRAGGPCRDARGRSLRGSRRAVDIIALAGCAVIM